MEITIVFDNLVERGRYLFGGNGFSAVIRSGGLTVLFDTGPGKEILWNMYALGIDVRSIDVVVLSHGHYDHTGGLPHLMENPKKPKLICHESFFLHQFREKRYIGPPITWKVAKNSFGAESFEGIKDIGEGLLAINMVEKPFPGEATRNLTDGLDDPFLYETSLVLDGKDLTLITGCSHRGIRNIILHVERMLGKRVGLVIGGFHLIDKSQEEKKKISEFFEGKGIKVVPCHCTGKDGRFLIKNILKGKAEDGFVGMRIKTNEEVFHAQRNNC